MVVSRYVVDGIVIAGLVVGTIGVLYLSQGILGSAGNSLVRRLIPALIVGALFALGYDRIFPHGFPFVLPDPFGWIEAIVAGFLIGITVTAPRDPFETAKGSSLVVLAILAGMAGLLFWLADTWANAYLPHPTSPALTILVVVFFGISFLLVIVTLSSLVFGTFGFLRANLASMSDQRLQVVGTILTLLGIATQFVSPLLDLLNIPVK